VRDALPSWENALPSYARERIFPSLLHLEKGGMLTAGGVSWLPHGLGLIICATKHIALSVAANVHARQYRRKVSAMAAAERDGNVWFQFRTNKAVSLSAAR